jgi:hypothetical protein
MNTLLEKQKCENCRYRVLRRYREMTREIAYLQCRRNAPQPSAKEHASAFWPIVDDDDWCGEWVER